MNMKMVRSGVVLALVILLALPGAALAQKKKKKDEGPQPQIPVQPTTPPRAPENEIIDYAISEMLGAWQIGDAEMMKNYYADDVLVVSGAYEPALVGWTNYVQAYKQQRTRIQQVRLDRRNTFIVVRGNVAWATYTWDFQAVVDGRQMAARGQTSLVLGRTGDKWLITLNHTSTVGEPQTAPPQPAAKPPGE